MMLPALSAGHVTIGLPERLLQQVHLLGPSGDTVSRAETRGANAILSVSSRQCSTGLFLFAPPSGTLDIDLWDALIKW